MHMRAFAGPLTEYVDGYLCADAGGNGELAGASCQESGHMQFWFDQIASIMLKHHPIGFSATGVLDRFAVEAFQLPSFVAGGQHEVFTSWGGAVIHCDLETTVWMSPHSKGSGFMVHGHGVLGELFSQLLEKFRPGCADRDARGVVQKGFAKITAVIINHHDPSIVEPWFSACRGQSDCAGHASWASTNDDDVYLRHALMV